MIRTVNLVMFVYILTVVEVVVKYNRPLFFVYVLYIFCIFFVYFLVTA